MTAACRGVSLELYLKLSMLLLHYYCMRVLTFVDAYCNTTTAERSELQLGEVWSWQFT
jgi:hypothetical protein